MAIQIPQRFNSAALPSMTESERREVSILLIDADAGTRASMRQVLVGLNFGQVTDAPDHNQALTKLQDRRITHVIFDAKKSTMSAKDFLLKLLEMDDKLVTIPSSFEPSVDDVFDLLCVGARGFLVKPFNSSSLDDAIIMATKGDRLSEAILFAKDRNEALASLIFTAFDKLAVIRRQARQFETAKREIPRAEMNLRRAVDIAKTFAKGGDDPLLGAMVEFCLDRASGPATKLGRFRKRLEARKSHLQKIVDGENKEVPDSTPPTQNP